MIKFFRHIRKRMLKESRFTRYTLYAIGEIILVVIGILIALGINSRYNAAQNEKEIQAILREVQEELLIDIVDAKRIYNFHIEHDSLARRVMNDEVTREMYMENTRYASVAWGYVSFSNKKGGYQRVLNNLENLPERYKCLLPHLNQLHVELQNDIDDFNARLKHSVHQVRDESKRATPQMSEFFRNPRTEEAAEYFLNDPYLKNTTTYYMLDLCQLVSAVNKYRVESLVLYNKIDSLLGNHSNDRPELLSILPDPEALKAYVGEYVPAGVDYDTDSLETMPISDRFEIEGGQLVLYTSSGRIPLYWHEDMTFYELGPDINMFLVNEKGQHITRWSDGIRGREYVRKADL
ncbi:MAG: hypothetical protein HKO93_04240 [Flavobacteriales bacterium]|nr:hypothetical protein [Flavobacteriales bacterium]